MQKVQVVVELRLCARSRALKRSVREAALHLLSKKTMFRSGFDLELQQELFKSFGVDRVYVSLPTSFSEREVPYFRSSLQVYCYRVNEEAAHEEATAAVGAGEEEQAGTSSSLDRTVLFSHYLLPHREFEGVWENLILPNGVKERLLNYSNTSLLFSEAKVDPNQICCNRVFLFHGPPGSGKTSLCQALAQKLAIRKSSHYPLGFHLLKVNSNALFSRFFSESGKLVNKLFDLVRELAEEREALIVLLIDEVESLTSSRSKVSAADPSDAVRVVNAMLTQIDRLRTHNNVMLFATSNITEQIDPAFLDRADVKLFLGNPDLQARFKILSSCLDALVSARIVREDAEDAMSENLAATCRIQDPPTNQALGLSAADWLWKAAHAANNVSGRALRKMPFQAHAFYIAQEEGGGDGPNTCSRAEMAQAFFQCLQDNIEK